MSLHSGPWQIDEYVLDKETETEAYDYVIVTDPDSVF